MLVDQRLGWHKEFEAGELNSSYLNEYKSIRLSESHRMGVGIERLCEYVLWLESKLQEKEEEEKQKAAQLLQQQKKEEKERKEFERLKKKFGES